MSRRTPSGMASRARRALAAIPKTTARSQPEPSASTPETDPLEGVEIVRGETGDSTGDETDTEPNATARSPSGQTAFNNRWIHQHFEPGDCDTSVGPPYVHREDSTVIKDAHATIFAITPSTRVHAGLLDELVYVAPQGRLLGVVDYRLELPPVQQTPRGEVRWEVVDHGIDEVRMTVDGALHTSSEGTHRPNLAYDLPSDTDTVTLFATVSATVEETVIDHSTGGDGVTTTRHEDEVTCWFPMDVTVYDLQAAARDVAVPDDIGVELSMNLPWNSVCLSPAGSEWVYSSWRYKTVQAPLWEELVHRTATGTDRVDSDVVPKTVRAYPSQRDPTDGLGSSNSTILREWEDPTAGATPIFTAADSGATELDEPARGVAVATSAIDRDTMWISGIVSGTTICDVPFVGDGHHVRKSDLSVSTIDYSARGVTYRLTLEDAHSGEPIVLDGEGKGYIEVGDTRLLTDESGSAVVELPRSGRTVARFEPAPWDDGQRAYSPATTML